MDLDIFECPDECLDECRSPNLCSPYSCNSCIRATSHVKEQGQVQMKTVTNIISSLEVKNTKLKKGKQEIICETEEDIDEEWNCAKLLCSMEDA
jgi:hypothetical protein